VHLLAELRRDDRDAGREHPERSPEGDLRVGVDARDLELLRSRLLVQERRSDPLRGGGDEASSQRKLELLRRRGRVLLDAPIVARGAPAEPARRVDRTISRPGR
jgi:hypothetical protein